MWKQMKTRAGEAPPGLHLDVMKGAELVEMLPLCVSRLCDGLPRPDCFHLSLVIALLSLCIYSVRSPLSGPVCLLCFSERSSPHGAFLGRICLKPHEPQQVKLHHVVQGRLHSQGKTPDPKQRRTGGAEGRDAALKGLLGLPDEPDRRLCLLLLVLSRVFKKKKTKSGLKESQNS